MREREKTKDSEMRMKKMKKDQLGAINIFLCFQLYNVFLSDKNHILCQWTILKLLTVNHDRRIEPL